MLMTCFQAMKLYGREPEQFDAIVTLFQMVLAPYPFHKIEAAFVEHIKRKTEMPTPADIVLLIEPPAPKPDWAAYVGIKAKMKDAFVMPAERRYVAWCETYVAENLKSYEDKQSANAEIAVMELKMLPCVPNAE